MDRRERRVAVSWLGVEFVSGAILVLMTAHPEAAPLQTSPAPIVGLDTWLHLLD